MLTKKVLQVIPSVGPLRGGPSALVRSLARDLAREGIETHIVTTDDNGRGRLQVPLGVPVELNGVTYWYFPRQTRFYTFSWPLTRWLAHHVVEFDLVHIHALFSYTSVAAAYWARRRGVPYVVGPLGGLSEWSMRNRRPWLKQLSFHLFESHVIRNAAYTVYASEQERIEAEKHTVTGRPAVVPHAVPGMFDAGAVGRFRAANPQLDGRRIVLSLSRLDPKKGLDLLFAAFANLRQAMPDVSLVVAGTGEAGFVRELKAKAVSLGIASDVLWPGFLDGIDKQAAFADADVFVLPSYSENFGIAAVEAMAAGIPVIVSDQVGIHREISQAGAGLTVSCDVGQLTDALVRLLNDATLRRSLADNGRSLVRQTYSSDAVTRKLMDVYTQVATKRSSDSRASHPNQLSPHEQPASPISVVILTLNEEVNLPRCLASVCGWVREVFVVDAGSSDSTRAIAETSGAGVFDHPFETHSSQWRWALGNLPIHTDWVLALDADQRVTPELAREISELNWQRLDGVDGFYIKRRQWFRGRWIKRGGYYPKFLLKLFRKKAVVMDPADLVDHHFYVSGPTQKLKHDLDEANRKEDDISFWIEKHNRYATLLAREELGWRRGTQVTAIEPSFVGTPDQRSLALKCMWRRMPLYLRPFLYFVYRYFLRVGILDGKQGAIFHFMQGFWFRLLVDIKLDEMLHESKNVSAETAPAATASPDAQIAKPV